MKFDEYFNTEPDPYSEAKKEYDKALGRLVKKEIDDKMKELENNTSISYEEKINSFKKIRENIFSKASDLREPIDEFGIVVEHPPMYDYLYIPVPEEALSPKVYQDIDIFTLSQNLKAQVQFAESQFLEINQTIKLELEGKSDVEKTHINQVISKIEDIVEQIGDNHYYLITVALHLYIYIERLFDRYQSINLLKLKGLIANFLISYNAHDPILALRLERDKITEFGKLVDIMNQLRSYLNSREFALLKRKVDRENQVEVPESAIYKPENPQVSKIPVRQASMVTNSEKVMSILTISERINKGFNFKRSADKDKEKSKKSTSDVSVFVIRSDQINLDLDNITNPSRFFVDVQNLINRYITIGLSLFGDALKLGQEINYDIYSKTFGLAARNNDNRTQMEQVEKVVYNYMINKIKMPQFAKVGFFLRNKYKHKIFYGKKKKGDLLYTFTLKPGETREINVSVTEKTKETRSSSSSIFDSHSTDAQQNFRDSIQNTLAFTNRTDTEIATSLENTISTHWGREDNFGVDAHLQYGDSQKEKSNEYESGGETFGKTVRSLVTPPIHLQINAEYGLTIDQYKDEDITSEIRDTINTTREDSGNTVTTASSEHLNRALSQRDVSVTESAETTVEITRQNSEKRRIPNPNPDASLTCFFHKIIQEYIEILELKQVDICFNNGSSLKPARIDGIDKLLNLYIKPEFESYKKLVKTFINEALKVKDYLGRTIDLLYVDAEGKPNINQKPYFSLLGAMNIPLNEKDLILERYREDIEGVVITMDKKTGIGKGVYEDSQAGDSALSVLTQRKINAEILKIVEEARKVFIENKLSIEIFEEIKNTSDEKLKLEYFFKMYRDNHDILDKLIISDALKNMMKRKDGRAYLKLDP